MMIRGGGSSGLMDQWLFAEDEAQVEGILGGDEILEESGSAVARYGRRPWAHLTHTQKGAGWERQSFVLNLYL